MELLINIFLIFVVFPIRLPLILLAKIGAVANKLDNCVYDNITIPLLRWINTKYL